ncbi:hypothetical protein N836_00150 [Leptolyngbya sp. Heron Island J]|uniref:hypothetical protein n=1 Tax=Leptolyngbya sp. Heron Island J TaxID=1385935 RepID=UPI0003B9A353|nr:hypothetical protein [Leptolyngbya sp. Heron Island J]ESA37125.1 hypothetical protein N836_00150 [Leptolyngbya sp. Heron Island J]
MTARKQPNLCHLAGGEKGGVGKSILSRTMIQLCLDSGLDFHCVETDRSNPDMARLYKSVIDVKYGILSEGSQYEDHANIIYNCALEKRTIVNLPAQVMPSLQAWFEALDLLSLAEEDGVSFIYWFVSDGGWDSLSLLRHVLTTFEGAAAWRTIIVLNEGTGGQDWSGFAEDDALQALIKTHDTPVIKLGRFNGTSTRNRIDRESLTFGQALNHTSFSSIERQRVKKYLREAYAAIESVGVL